MKTTLQFYVQAKERLENEAARRQLLTDEHWLYQELCYRVFVLGSLSFLEATAPIGTDAGRIKAHYIAFDALVSHMLYERRYAESSDANEQRRRETAYTALRNIQQDYRRRFSGYMPVEPHDYSADISKAICTILPAWCQYRNTLLRIKNTEED